MKTKIAPSDLSYEKDKVYTTLKSYCIYKIMLLDMFGRIDINSCFIRSRVNQVRKNYIHPSSTQTSYRNILGFNFQLS